MMETEEIQQRLDKMGVTPNADRSKGEASLADRLFMLVVGGGVLFLVAANIYEYGFVHGEPNPVDVTESMAAAAPPSPSRERLWSFNAVPAASATAPDRQPAPPETALSSGRSMADDDSRTAVTISESDGENGGDSVVVSPVAVSPPAAMPYPQAPGWSPRYVPPPRYGNYAPYPYPGMPYGYYPPNPWYPPYGGVPVR